MNRQPSNSEDTITTLFVEILNADECHMEYLRANHETTR